MDNIIGMPKKYRNLILSCILLAAIFVCLVAVPNQWYIKSGLTQREYDQAISKASDDALYAKNASERQVAKRHVQRLNKMATNGLIDKKTDMRWMLNGIRFILISAILLLCWRIAHTVVKSVIIMERTTKKKSA